MERLTDRHTHRIRYNGEKDLECSNYCDNCGHANCDIIREMLYKLKSYENAEENGLLVRLPCKVGTPVYVVYKKNQNEIEYDIDCFSFDIDCIDDIGKTVFLTRAEAEAKLKEMEGKNADSN